MSKQEPLLVDKGCAERGCMGYDDRDGDKPVKMRVFDDDDDIQEYKKPWRDLTDMQIEQVYFEVVKEHRGAPMPWGQVQFGRALLKKFKQVNT